MFSVQLLYDKVINIIQIKEALNIKAHITQEGRMFFLLQYNYCWKKLYKLNEVKEAHKIQAQGLQ